MTKKKNTSVNVIAGCGRKLVRFSYPHVFEPHAIEGGKPKYSIMLIIDKDDTETVQAIRDAMNQCAVEAAANGMWGGSIPSDLRNPLRDGDTDPAHKGDPTCAGKYFLNASSTYRPGLVDRNNREIINPDEFYPGCYGRAQLNVFGYDRVGNRGIGVGLNNLQKVMDGDNLSGAQDPKTVFGAFDNSSFPAEDNFTVGESLDDFAVTSAGNELPF